VLVQVGIEQTTAEGALARRVKLCDAVRAACQKTHLNLALPKAAKENGLFSTAGLVLYNVEQPLFDSLIVPRPTATQESLSGLPPELSERIIEDADRDRPIETLTDGLICKEWDSTKLVFHSVYPLMKRDHQDALQQLQSALIGLGLPVDCELHEWHGLKPASRRQVWEMYDRHKYAQNTLGYTGLFMFNPEVWKQRKEVIVVAGVLDDSVVRARSCSLDQALRVWKFMATSEGSPSIDAEAERVTTESLRNPRSRFYEDTLVYNWESEPPVLLLTNALTTSQVAAITSQMDNNMGEDWPQKNSIIPYSWDDATVPDKDADWKDLCNFFTTRSANAPVTGSGGNPHTVVCIDRESAEDDCAIYVELQDEAISSGLGFRFSRVALDSIGDFCIQLQEGNMSWYDYEDLDTWIWTVEDGVKPFTWEDDAESG